MTRKALAAVLAAITFVLVLWLWPREEPATQRAPTSAPLPIFAAARDEPPPAPAEPLLPGDAPARGDAHLEGSVSDHQGGRVVGAIVIAHRLGDFMGSALRTETDAQGLFTIDGLAPGNWEIAARIPRVHEVYASVSLAAGSRQRVDLVQPPQGGITGQLRDPDGGLIAKADVSATCGGLSLRRRTDAEGAFVIEPLPIGASCRIAPFGYGWLQSGSATATVSAPHAQVVVVARRPAVMRGRVVDEAGEPIERPFLGYSWGSSSTVKTEDGAFSIPVWREPRPLWVRGKVSVTLPAAPEDGPDVELGDLVMRDGRVLEGSVRDVSGSPLAGAWITLDGRVLTRTRDDGAFKAAGLPLNDLELLIRHPRRRERVVKVAAQATRLEVTLPDGERVTGQVTWHDGMVPVPLWVNGARLHTEVQPDGRFVLEGLLPGPLTVTVAAQAGEIYSPPVRLEVVEGVEAHVNAVVVPRTGRAVLLFEKAFDEVPRVKVEVDGAALEVSPAWNHALTECRITRLPLGRVTFTAGDRAPVMLDVTAAQIARAAVK